MSSNLLSLRRLAELISGCWGQQRKTAYTVRIIWLEGRQRCGEAGTEEASSGRRVRGRSGIRDAATACRGTVYILTEINSYFDWMKVTDCWLFWDLFETLFFGQLWIKRVSQVKNKMKCLLYCVCVCVLHYMDIVTCPTLMVTQSNRKKDISILYGALRISEQSEP